MPSSTDQLNFSILLKDVDLGQICIWAGPTKDKCVGKRDKHGFRHCTGTVESEDF